MIHIKYVILTIILYKIKEKYALPSLSLEPFGM